MNITGTLNSAIDAWLNNCDVTAATKSDYRSRMKEWFMWLSANKHNPREPTSANVIEYKEYMRSINRSPYTINHYTIVLRLFYRYCQKMHWWSDITSGVKYERQTKYYNKLPLNINQCAELLELINTKTLKGLRDYIIISLMLTTGLRVCEVERTNEDDLDQMSGEKILWVRGKGQLQKGNYVILAPEVTELLEEYIAKADVAAGSYEQIPLFRSLSHRSKYDSRMSRLAIAFMIHKRLHTAGIIGKKYTCHSLRHTYGCTLVLNGVEIEQVKTLMRHASESTTMRYVMMANEQKLLADAPNKNISRLINDEIFRRRQNWQS